MEILAFSPRYRCKWANLVQLVQLLNARLVTVYLKYKRERLTKVEVLCMFSQLWILPVQRDTPPHPCVFTTELVFNDYMRCTVAQCVQVLVRGGAGTLLRAVVHMHIGACSWVCSWAHSMLIAIPCVWVPACHVFSWLAWVQVASCYRLGACCVCMLGQAVCT